ncbi:hypothetical protein EDEG_01948 [Edhazardia aedis USNM 41457]|uniref:Uncharacterized protein n=1 Tax=Edhazardia aedis (strain USNM 41457) TaxID=1003232 RepID=J8ZVR1_EDHAE|nr:hypothetical protein EDEG_01948 [Edhazardia aedis USNM 41457]|eukprot:EJW03753.1 hypothetical protein EDEG_01948 [Edhazardia aedis USNM 41457]
MYNFISSKKYEKLKTALQNNKIVILQGQPGTAKTHTLMKICKELNFELSYFESIKNKPHFLNKNVVGTVDLQSKRDLKQCLRMLNDIVNPFVIEMRDLVCYKEVQDIFDSSFNTDKNILDDQEPSNTVSNSLNDNLKHKLDKKDTEDNKFDDNLISTTLKNIFGIKHDNNASSSNETNKNTNLYDNNGNNINGDLVKEKNPIFEHISVSFDSEDLDFITNEDINEVCSKQDKKFFDISNSNMFNDNNIVDMKINIENINESIFEQKDDVRIKFDIFDKNTEKSNNDTKKIDQSCSNIEKYDKKQSAQIKCNTSYLLLCSPESLIEDKNQKINILTEPVESFIQNGQNDFNNTFLCDKTCDILDKSVTNNEATENIANQPNGILHETKKFNLCTLYEAIKSRKKGILQCILIKSKYGLAKNVENNYKLSKNKRFFISDSESNCIRSFSDELIVENQDSNNPNACDKVKRLRKSLISESSSDSFGLSDSCFETDSVKRKFSSLSKPSDLKAYKKHLLITQKFDKCQNNSKKDFDQIRKKFKNPKDANKEYKNNIIETQNRKNNNSSGSFYNNNHKRLRNAQNQIKNYQDCSSRIEILSFDNITISKLRNYFKSFSDDELVSFNGNLHKIFLQQEFPFINQHIFKKHSIFHFLGKIFYFDGKTIEGSQRTINSVYDINQSGNNRYEFQEQPTQRNYITNKNLSNINNTNKNISKSFDTNVYVQYQNIFNYSKLLSNTNKIKLKDIKKNLNHHETHKLLEYLLSNGIEFICTKEYKEFLNDLSLTDYYIKQNRNRDHDDCNFMLVPIYFILRSDKIKPKKFFQFQSLRKKVCKIDLQYFR